MTDNKKVEPMGLDDVIDKIEGRKRPTGKYKDQIDYDIERTNAGLQQAIDIISDNRTRLEAGMREVLTIDEDLISDLADHQNTADEVVRVLKAWLYLHDLTAVFMEDNDD